MVRMGPRMGPRLGPTLGPNPAAGVLAIRDDGHNLHTGDGPISVQTAGVLPSPLMAATGYYAIRLDANHLLFAVSRADAIAETPIVLTDTGSGALQIVPHSAVSPAVPLVFSDTFTTDFNDSFLFMTSGSEELGPIDGPFRLTNSGGALPSGLLGGVDYYFASWASDTVTLSLTVGGATAAFADDGTGTHTITAKAGALHYAPVAYGGDGFFTVETF